MKKLPKIITFLLSLTFLLSSIVATQAVKATTFDTINQGISETGQTAGFPQADGGQDREFFTKSLLIYIRGAVVLLAFIFMAMILYGGWLWMSAKGNEQQVTKGKEILIQAIIGFIIAIGSRIIVEFIITNIPSPTNLTP